MGHNRREIRALICSLLKNKTHAGNNVYNWRLFTLLDDCHYPNINVLTHEENINSISTNNIMMERILKISVVISDLIDSKNQNKCDDISEDVENILLSYNSQEYLFNLEKVEYFIDSETRKTIANCHMIFECKYYTEVKKSNLLDEFNSLSLEVSNAN